MFVDVEPEKFRLQQPTEKSSKTQTSFDLRK